MTRPARFAIAIFLTLAAMPCMGFFLIGFLHSWELNSPMQRLPWQVIYGFLELVSLVIIIFAWRYALRPERMAGTCMKCGFSLRDNTTGVCPECGIST